MWSDDENSIAAKHAHDDGAGDDLPTKLPCHRCKDKSDVRMESSAGYAWLVYCNSCSGGEYEVSTGWTKAKAIAQWNEDVTEREDMEVA